MIEKLHRLWYMLMPERRSMYDIDLVHQEIGCCLGIIGELNRIIVPSHDAPPPAMVLPQLNRDEFPEVGRKGYSSWSNDLVSYRPYSWDYWTSTTRPVLCSSITPG
ncbi:hypothetical protein OROGR_027570 [Orobanche gracilis]